MTASSQKPEGRSSGGGFFGQVILGVILTIVIWGGIYFFAVAMPMRGEVHAERKNDRALSAVAASGTESHEEKPDTRKHITHVPLPEPLKAVYMTSCVVGTPSLRNAVVKVIEDTEVNALVIDIKDFSGTLSFDPGTTTAWYPAWQHARCGTADMEAFIAELHAKGIFVIGRITVFQDPFYTALHPEDAVKRADRTTVWKDRKGLSFIDVGARAYWDHVIDLATISYNIGFDELNFDYVRYPSDGNMTDISFPQAEATEYGKQKAPNLELFFAYLSEKLRDPERYAIVIHEGDDRKTPWISADLFGMTTSAADDMNIGQIFERALPYFDVIAPMVYPSHYPKGFIGLANPNSDPHGVVAYAMGEAVRRAAATTTPIAGFTHERIGTSTPALYTKPSYDTTHLRTWIQDFDYGGDYGPKEVRAQMTASTDVGVASWMIWSPSNKYTRDALHDAE